MHEQWLKRICLTWETKVGPDWVYNKPKDLRVDIRAAPPSEKGRKDIVN